MVNAPRMRYAPKRTMHPKPAQSPPPPPLSSFGTLSRGVPLFDRFFAWICDPARSGGLFVTEQELADLFQVSRTPLREVLQQAQMIGLIRREPNRSIEVPALTIEEMHGLSVTREHLEGLVTATIAERLMAQQIDIAPLERLNRRMRALADAEDSELLLQAGLAFHAEMRRLAGNAAASRLLEQVLLCLERYRQLVQRHSERGRQIIDEHEVILAALGRCDATEAAVAARAHIASARAFYTRALHALGSIHGA